jgi:tetratricopeptide (TPR) repeat protein
MEEIDYWESEQRRSLIVGDAVRAAQSAAEIGRLLALAGETAQADSILRSALDALARVGSPVGRTQYYLGLAWEIGGDFEKAQRWLLGALAAATNDERLTADCIYQLGIVQIREDSFSEGLETFRAAHRAYLALGREREAADALFMAAQAALAGGDDAGAAEQMLLDVLSAQPLDPEITSRARDLLEDIHNLS